MRTDAPEVIREWVYDMYVPAIAKQHPRKGSLRLREVLAVLRVIYRYRPPESFTQNLTVFATIDSTERPHLPDAARQLAHTQLSTLSWESCAIQILPNGQCLAWEEQPSALPALSERAVVYVLRPDEEVFVVGDEEKLVPNPNGSPSAFASTGYFLLEEALTAYAEQMARRCTCHILRGAWQNERRLLFKNRPERIMRRSLTQYLRSSLRDHAEIREEQNVTETRPIDIKVTWSNNETLSLIEIKWLGKSTSASGTGISKRYSAPSRPREGMQQLVEYLEGNLDEVPTKPCKGYLVIYDGRRRGITQVSTNAVDPGQAWAYRTADIAWPDEVARTDVAEPRRLYLEPGIQAPLRLAVESIAGP